MFRLALPLLVVVIGIVIATALSRGRSGAGRDRVVIDTTLRDAPGPVAHPTADSPSTPVADDGPAGRSLSGLLDRWVNAGLISAEQSAAIAAHEAAPAAPGAPAGPRRRVPMVAEALGYLGGMLGIIGITVWVAGFWRDIAGGTRLGVSAGVAVVLIAVGWLVRAGDEPALARLRGFVWLAGSAASGVVGGVVANDVLDATSGQSVAIGAATGVFVVSAALWAGRVRPAQQFSALAALEVGTGLVVWALSGSVASGLAVLAVSSLVLLAGVRRITPTPWLATLIGAAGALIGSALPIERWHEPGSLLAIAVGLAVATIAETPRLTLGRGERIALLVFAVVDFLFNVPSTIGYFARDAGIVTGLVVWLVGAASIAVVTARRVVHPVTIEIAGGVLVVGGGAAIGFQDGFVGLATVFGFLSALAMLALGTRPGRILMSVTGSLGLLVNVPWAISHFFPGENRAPLLIAVSGLLLVGIAVVLTRMGGRFRRELQR